MDYDRNYFNGKTALVTGAASGIGLALIEELLESKAAKVVMADINQDNLNEHGKRLKEQYGDRVKGIVCDVTIEENVRKMIGEAAEFFGGRIDLLFNNAGAAFAGAFGEMTDADWKIAFDLNFFSALYGMRAVLPVMVKQGGGPGADLCQTVLYPQRLEAEHGWQGNGTVQWTALTYEQNPMQAHIIKALAELPMLEMSSVMMAKGAIFLMPSMARVLE